MATFIHTADTHLGYAQYNKPERKTDYLDAFTQVVDAAIDEDVDAVIHAGDLFNTSRPGTSAIRAALAQLIRLQEHDIPFLSVVGNHDGTQETDWIQILSDMDLAIRLGREPVVVGNVAFYGLHHVPVARRGQLEYTFEPNDADLAALVAHGLFSPISSLADWDLGDVLDLSPIRFDAALLGDDHTPAFMRWENTLITYPGSTDRTKVDQRDGRVYNYITVDASRDGHEAFHVEQHDLDTRPHIYIETTLESGQGAEVIEQVLAGEEVDADVSICIAAEATDRNLTERDLDGAIIAIIIDGDDTEDISPAALEQYAREQGVLVARTSDRRKLKDLDVDLDVSFVDPDAAVQEQLRQMGLSVAVSEVEAMARDIDEEGPAKTNLDTLAYEQFTERIGDDPDAFDRPADIEAPDADAIPIPEEAATGRDGSLTDQPPQGIED